MLAYFMGPVVEQNYLLDELRDPEKLRHRRHDRVPGPGAEHHGGSDGTDGGYTIAGRLYYGGRWNGPLTTTQIAELQAAGHGARIHYAGVWDDFNRANGALGNAVSGQAWTFPNGTFTVDSNKAKPGAAGTLDMAVIDTGRRHGIMRASFTLSSVRASVALVGRRLGGSGLIAATVENNPWDGQIVVLDDAGGSFHIVKVTPINLGQTYEATLIVRGKDAVFSVDGVEMIRTVIPDATGAKGTQWGIEVNIAVGLDDGGSRIDNFSFDPDEELPLPASID